MLDSTQKYNKILIIRFGAIGDVVHSSIIQKAVKNFKPQDEVHFMTSELIAPLISRDENLSRVITFDMKKKDNPFYLLHLGLKLRKEKYDYVINLQNSFRNQFLSVMTGAKYIKRAEHAEHVTDSFYLTTTKIYKDITKPDSITIYLDTEKSKNFKEMLSLYPKPHIMISPGGENDKNRQGRIWSFDRWNELGQRLLKEYGGTIFVVGSKYEYDLHNKNINIKDAKILSGDFSLEESANFFSFADLFISGDSGPLHIASAVDVNTLGLYGSTDGWYCGPYGSKGHFIQTTHECRHCGQKECRYLKDNEIYTPCMNEISADEVINYISKKNLVNSQL